jgi:hypothetical protein
MNISSMAMSDALTEARREYQQFITTPLNSLPLVSTFLFEVNPTKANKWCELHTDFLNILRAQTGAVSVYALQRCPNDGHCVCGVIDRHDNTVQKQQEGHNAIVTGEQKSDVGQEDSTGSYTKDNEDEAVNTGAASYDKSTWPFRNHSPYHSFIGVGTFENMEFFESAVSNVHAVKLLETHLSEDILSSFLVMQMWHKYNSKTAVSIARDANCVDGNGVRLKSRRAGNFFMMRTNFLKLEAKREDVLPFLSRVAYLSMQEEIKEPATEDGTADKAEDTNRHSCIFYDILVSNNMADYQEIVELVSWSSKEAYKIQKSSSSSQEKYDGMARVVNERQTVTFWERNNDILPEPLY